MLKFAKNGSIKVGNKFKYLLSLFCNIRFHNDSINSICIWLTSKTWKENVINIHLIMFLKIFLRIVWFYYYLSSEAFAIMSHRLKMPQ